MKPFVFALILWIECFICPMMAQEPEPSGLLLFRDLHIRCEEAYKHNDYTAMKLSLDERQGHIDNGSMAGMSKEDSVEDLSKLILRWKDSVVALDRLLYEDARKEFSLSGMPDFESDPFVRSVKEHIQVKSALADQVLEKLNSI